MSQQSEAMERKIVMLCERNFARDKFLPVIERRLENGSINPQWAAWRQWRKDHGLGTAMMDQRDRWTVPSEFPPADIDGQLQQAHFGGLSGKYKRGQQAAE